MLLKKSSKYDRQITGKCGSTVTVDVYAVLTAFDVTCPATAHAVKKLLMPGARGHKDRVTDLNEAAWAIERAIEMVVPVEVTGTTETVVRAGEEGQHLVSAVGSGEGSGVIYGQDGSGLTKWVRGHRVDCIVNQNEGFPVPLTPGKMMAVQVRKPGQAARFDLYRSTGLEWVPFTPVAAAL